MKDIVKDSQLSVWGLNSNLASPYFSGFSLLNIFRLTFVSKCSSQKPTQCSRCTSAYVEKRLTCLLSFSFPPSFLPIFLSPLLCFFSFVLPSANIYWEPKLYYILDTKMSPYFHRAYSLEKNMEKNQIITQDMIRKDTQSYENLLIGRFELIRGNQKRLLLSRRLQKR